MKALLAMAASLLLSACGSYSGSSDPVAGGGNGGGNPGGGGAAKDEQSHFSSNVAPTLDFCRTCHVPGGVADTAEGKRFMLSSDKSKDYPLLKASWTALGRGVENNLILQNASGQHTHSGGAPWPVGSPGYTNMKILLGCWDNPGACAALLGGGVGGGGPLLPLLGSADETGHRFWATKFCEGKPDSTPVSWDDDPRHLLQVDGPIFKNGNSAVWVNDPWENCHTEALFENQARANAILVAKGEAPRHTAKRNPTTCGEFRQRAAHGFDFIARHPTTGDAGAIPASIYGNVWKQWGLAERPSDFDAQLVERYGFAPSPIPNPYPIDDEEKAQLSASFGGTGKLPLGWSQGRTEDGKYSGNLGINCFICHAGRIGSGEAVGYAGEVQADPALISAYGKNPSGSFMGSPNSLQDFGLQINELLRTGLLGKSQFPPFIGLPVNVNTTRGTHAADDDIVILYMLRDVDTLDHAFTPIYLARDVFWLTAFGGSTGDQDSPAWWWTHNKARYLWFGAHSSDGSRGDMYFGAGANLQGGHWNQAREGDFDDVRLWHDSVEGPKYPYGFCSGSSGARQSGDPAGCIDRPLAEQGAILFHNKDLWAEGMNENRPAPEGGNGSCAGCHGAYSPRYANDPNYLPHPKLVGMASYTVPLDIIGTDRKQAENWTSTVRGAVSTIWNSYPDAVEGYRMPEEKLPGMEAMDDLIMIPGNIKAGGLALQLQTLVGSLNIPGLREALQPVVSLLQLIPGLPLDDFVGRIRGACSFQTEIIGYTAPPLHSVWASAPYFHNGSVPNVWEVLKPSDRKQMWKRRETPEGTTSGVDRGFDPNLGRALDFQNLGWKYDEVKCGDTGIRGIPFYQCQPEYTILWKNNPLKGILDLIQGSVAWDINFEIPAVGQWQVETRKIQNTLLYGKGNQGHEFTEELTDDERRALVEYLKTL
ncbi:hypothetical protein D0B54_23850 [Solimonas sp. K1W22B-7]|uniref:c-type cytochrome n=1 Tax=Solimonas sp. K1W22B-7 TaxID=2303331 RepID=UPI000E331CA0|nr:hypothetical protein [Solimonas sp. K1W22B-7]AXQ31533.1 hypothetical protein D0B54_23850 [Solimonas sp. K1W22B-7]